MPEGKQEKPEEKKPETEDSAMPSTLHDNFEEKKGEMISAAEEAITKHFSAGSDKLDEKALLRLREMVEKQKKAIADLFEERKRAYEEGVKKGSSDREKLGRELIAGSTTEARQRIRLLDQTIRSKKKGEYIVTDEVYEIEAVITGCEKLLKEDKQGQEIAAKLAEGKELTDEDYKHIISILNPYNIVSQKADIQSTFEATIAGVLIGLLKPEQKERLLELFMVSDKKAQTAEVIDAMLRTGSINRDLGEKLFLEAIAKGVLTQERYNKEFKAKIDQGFYQEEAARNRKLIEDELNSNYRGRVSENIMSRGVGSPLLGAAAGIWGLLLMGLNVWSVLANKEDDNKIESLLANPYIYAGGALMLGGAEVATSGLKKGSGSIMGMVGGGVVSNYIDSMGEDEEAEGKKNARARLTEIYENAPKELLAYLDNGGFNTIKKLREEKTKKGERPTISLAELTAAETDSAQKTRLANLKATAFVTENTINIQLTVVGEAASVLGINTAEEFTKLTDEIKKKKQI
jgi:hypothetical protein